MGIANYTDETKEKFVQMPDGTYQLRIEQVNSDMEIDLKTNGSWTADIGTQILIYHRHMSQFLVAEK